MSTITYSDAPERRRFHPLPWMYAVGALVVIGVVVALLLVFLLRATPVAVARRDVIASIPLSGQAVTPPSARVDVRVAQPAPVERVEATVGQRVQRGDRLFELYYASVETARQQAEAQLRTAQQDYAEAQARYTGQLTQARQNLEQAQAAVRTARRQALAQARALPPPPPPGSDGALPSDSETDNTFSPTAYSREAEAESPELQSALAQQQQAQQQLAQTKADQAQALAPYQEQIDQAKAALAAAATGARAAVVTAPISGTVVALAASPGQSVAANTPVATIIDLTTVEVQAPFSPDQANRITVGRPVVLTFKELPGQPFRGRVARIVTESALASRSPRYLALIDFDNSQGLVRPQMTAQAGIVLNEARHVLAVPNSALRTDQGHPYVEVRRGTDWVRRGVTLGLQGNAYTEVRSGLQEGDIVRA